MNIMNTNTTNKIVRFLVLVGFFIIPFIPLVVVNSFFFPFITGKNFLFRILLELMMGGWVVLAVTDKKYRPKATWLWWSLVAFIVVIFFADVFSIYPYKSFWSNFERMEGYITLIQLFAYFIIAATVVRAERLWNWFWNTNIFVSLIIAVYGFLQLAGKLQINQSDARLDATFGNATYLAIYALFIIFLTAYIVVSDSMFLLIPWPADQNSARAQHKWTKAIVGAIIIVTNAAILYYTATRGSMLGLIGGAGLAALLIALFERNRRMLRKTAIGVVVAAVVVVVGFIGLRHASFVEKSDVLSRFSSISLSDPTTQSRFILWHMAWEGAIQSPKTAIIGWGQESYNYVFNTYYDPRLYSQEQWFDRTHDIIFDWLVAGGFLGLAAYLWFFGACIWSLWKSSTFNVAERSVLTGLLAGYFIHNLFVFDNIVSYILFFSVAAFIQSKISGTALQDEKPAAAADVSAVSTNRIILPIAVIATILVVYIVNYKPIMANTALISALTPHNQTQNSQYGTDVTQNVADFEKALSYKTFGTPEIREQIFSMAESVIQTESQTQTAITGGDALIKLASDQADLQTLATPNDARYFLLAGVLADRLNDPDTAITYLTKAVSLSPDKQSILFELGSGYLVKKDYAQAEATFKQAYQFDTDDQDAALFYAISAVYNNDQATASSIIATLPRKSVVDSDALLYAYYTLGENDKVLILWKAREAENPSDPQTHVSVAAAYLLNKDNKDAIAEIQTAESLYPDFKTQGDAYIKEIESGKALQ